MSYSQVMLDRLASGVGIVGITPNLVDDTGASNLPNGSKTVFKFSNKAKSGLQVIKSTDSGVTWSLLTPTTHYSINYVTNTVTFVTAPASTDLIIIANSSAILPYIQSNPLPILDVEPKVTASNSHSIYKDAMITSQVSGKIPTGDSDGGLESKVLENAELGVKYTIICGTPNTFALDVGDTFAIYNNDTSYSGRVMEVLTGGAAPIHYIYPTSYDFDNGYYEDAANLATTTQHQALQLNSDNSSASKYFKAISQGANGVVASVYGKEMVYDVTFGDNEEFDQLTNSTDIDLNGNTIRTFVGHLPINGKVK